MPGPVSRSPIAACILPRRHLLGAAAGAAVGIRSALAHAAADRTLRILDAIGNLPLTELGYELYTKEHPGTFDRLKFDEIPASRIEDVLRKGTETPGSLPDIVTVGIDRMVEGLRRGWWQALLPPYAARLPDLRSLYRPAAWDMQGYAEGHGLVLSYVVTGPLLIHSPASTLPSPLKVADLPRWLEANPGRFGYARPTTSRSGRDFLTSLPYLLGDAVPSDPEHGWDRTWSFLTEIGRHIDDYPLSVKTLLLRIEKRSADLVVGTFGDAFAARAEAKLGIRLGAFENGHWLNDAHYAAIPTQVADSRTLAIVDVLAFMLGQRAQGFALRQGSFFPGAAIGDVLAAPTEPSSAELTRASDAREFDALVQGGAFVPPLFGPASAYALDRWERQIRLKR